MDHAAGSQLIKQDTGAKYMVMDADVSLVQSGGKSDFHYANDHDMYFPPSTVDKVIHDGDQVKLGGTVLTAHLTAGHTKGCTTWTMQAIDRGKPYQVVIVGSLNVNLRRIQSISDVMDHISKNLMPSSLLFMLNLQGSLL